MSFAEDTYTDEIQLRVAGGTSMKALAGSILKNIEEGRRVSMIAIGAGAVNQMMKAMCRARMFASQSGRDLYFSCGFKDERIDGELKSAIRVFIKVAR